MPSACPRCQLRAADRGNRTKEIPLSKFRFFRCRDRKVVAVVVAVVGTGMIDEREKQIAAAEKKIGDIHLREKRSGEIETETVATETITGEI